MEKVSSFGDCIVIGGSEERVRDEMGEETGREKNGSVHFRARSLFFPEAQIGLEGAVP